MGYVCLLIDLFNREIIGYSAGYRKTKYLVLKAIRSSKYPLNKIGIFHTDRGLEFKNKDIDDLLKSFNIERSLSKKGSPYDNSIAESTNKALKNEFIYQNIFNSIDELERKLAEKEHLNLSL